MIKSFDKPRLHLKKRIYIREYIDFVESHKLKVGDKTGERHHVIPKLLVNKNPNQTYIVRLSHEDHITAHWILNFHFLQIDGGRDIISRLGYSGGLDSRNKLIMSMISRMRICAINHNYKNQWMTLKEVYALFRKNNPTMKRKYWNWANHFIQRVVVLGLPYMYEWKVSV